MMPTKRGKKAHSEWEASDEDPKPPEPIEPDDPGEEPTKPTLTPKSVVWTGPGNPNSSTDPSWFTAYSNTLRMTGPSVGQVKLCNVRFSCYDSPFGSKSQIHEGFRIYNPDES
jgi:hypothetical protein